MYNLSPILIPSVYMYVALLFQTIRAKYGPTCTRITLEEESTVLYRIHIHILSTHGMYARY